MIFPFDIQSEEIFPFINIFRGLSRRQLCAPTTLMAFLLNDSTCHFHFDLGMAKNSQ